MTTLIAKDLHGISRPLRMDNSTRGLITLSPAESAIHEGNHYFLKNWFDMTGKGATLDFLFFTPPLPIRIHGNGRITAENEFNVQFFEDVIVSSYGVPVPSTNNDRASDKVSNMPVWASPTVADIGHDIWPGKVGMAGQTVSVNFNYEYFPKPETYYMTRLTKVNKKTHWVDVDFWWYETPHLDATKN